MNLSFFLISLILAGIFSQNRQTSGSLEDFRADFHRADSEEETEALIARPVGETDKSKLLTIKAYKAIARAQSAAYAFLPTTKYKYFKEGKTALEAVISQEKSLENVYLRLILQLNLPKFLSYHQNIKTDLVFFKENINKSGISVKDRQMFIDTLLKSENTEHDLSFLREIRLN